MSKKTVEAEMWCHKETREVEMVMPQRERERGWRWGVTKRQWRWRCVVRDRQWCHKKTEEVEMEMSQVERGGGDVVSQRDNGGGDEVSEIDSGVTKRRRRWICKCHR